MLALVLVVAFATSIQAHSLGGYDCGYRPGLGYRCYIRRIQPPPIECIECVYEGGINPIPYPLPPLPPIPPVPMPPAPLPPIPLPQPRPCYCIVPCYYDPCLAPYDLVLSTSRRNGHIGHRHGYRDPIHLIASNQDSKTFENVEIDNQGHIDVHTSP